MEFNLIAAFLSGLMGGAHCVGMCGGIVSALTFGMPKSDKSSMLSFHVAYNIGRITTYVFAGALVAGIASLASNLTTLNELQRVLQLIAGSLMILLGLYLAGWWRILIKLEKLGTSVWKLIEPLGRKLLPVRTPLQAFFVGMVWGWLPCGLVYTALIMAIATSHPGHGALVMLSFGLGTLPTLMAMGFFAAKLVHFSRNPIVQTIAGLVVIGFGIQSILIASIH